jgi:hypothetical protein
VTLIVNAEMTRMIDNPKKTPLLLAALKEAVPFKVELVPSLVNYLGGTVSVFRYSPQCVVCIANNYCPDYFSVTVDVEPRTRRCVSRSAERFRCGDGLVGR